MTGEHCEIIDGARVRISDNATDADRAAISEIVAAAKRYIAEREGPQPNRYEGNKGNVAPPDGVDWSHREATS